MAEFDYDIVSIGMCLSMYDCEMYCICDGDRKKVIFCKEEK